MKMIEEIRLVGPQEVEIEGRRYGCRIGRGGVLANKREGDLATPKGCFPLRLCYWRPDRMAAPQSSLPLVALTPEDGWCDDPADPNYNRAVKLPYPARHEKLWREDHVYDLIIPMGYNDEAIIPGKGSAIFMHLMRPDGVGTEGCIALKREDLLALLPRLSTRTMVVVS
jgi:L,D-peptidoglycan transpeptidase YkuD (ErfK/YbiS/YcfS/YnhG family)